MGFRATGQLNLCLHWQGLGMPQEKLAVAVSRAAPLLHPCGSSCGHRAMDWGIVVIVSPYASRQLVAQDTKRQLRHAHAPTVRLGLQAAQRKRVLAGSWQARRAGAAAMHYRGEWVTQRMEGQEGCPQLLDGAPQAMQPVDRVPSHTVPALGMQVAQAEAQQLWAPLRQLQAEAWQGIGMCADCSR